MGCLALRTFACDCAWVSSGFIGKVRVFSHVYLFRWVRSLLRNAQMIVVTLPSCLTVPSNVLWNCQSTSALSKSFSIMVIIVGPVAAPECEHSPPACIKCWCNVIFLWVSVSLPPLICLQSPVPRISPPFFLTSLSRLALLP